ncbi:hypothetical protein ACFFKH_12180 [Micromonospora marina]|uniref:Membrane domain of glycerophosphoryl diester phosphodiesterase n=1 Tax=Micromonospora marina TaxID=307120 RepID=A0A1C4YWW2_9ACTN|nr:hypothetical protein [Micromonospora marina]SCF25252.1 hypothetical protein GA0070215_11364 [Micromonospora marina]
MSDLPPSGSTEPAASGPPADPTAPPPPAAGPAPGQSGTTGGVTPAAGASGADPWAGHTGPVPIVPEYDNPQPGAPNPATPPGWTAPGDAPPGPTSQGWSAPGTPPQGWDAPGTPPQGWNGPAYPGHPMPGAAYPMPGAGYPVPAGPGAYAGWFPGIDPQDPLVNPPHAGIGPWFARCTAALRRGWRQLLPIVLLTQVVPGVVIGVLTLVFSPEGELATAPDGAPVLPDGFWGQMFAFYGVLLSAGLIFGLLQAVGWAAGTWVVTRQAAGEPTGLGAAFRYGLRRALGLWGWTLLVSLLVMLGACFCLLPGLYAAFALALFGPVYLFERREPVGRAWRMFHSRFGMVLGRVALVMAVLFAATVLDAVVGGISGAVFGVEPMKAVGTAIGAVAFAVFGALLAAPAYLAQQVGLVVTYAEQRAQEGPVNAARLAAELG